MSLQDWFNNGWLRKHKTSNQEIANLLEIVKRDIKDAEFSEVSPDWRFGIAYNAALKLCTILLYAEGFKPERNLAHYRTIQAMSLILGNRKEEDVNYLNTCRIKRNTIEYDYAGGTTHSDADELISFVSDLQDEVFVWIENNHPELL
jgi:hypothetical protein|tara:strand:+ start:616 stop:1056 length:441 start_codon:yes stop_codon:yes gene_type:complete